MKLQQLSGSEVISALKSGAQGLSSSEAARRIQAFGPNRIEERERENLWIRLAKEFTHFFAVILWIAAALALLSDWRTPGQGMGALALAIIGVILVNGIFSFWQEYRAERAVEALRKMLPHKVRVFRDAILTEVLSEDLVPGDVVELREGDSVPADCRVLECTLLRVNNATLTGESAPRPLTAAAEAGAEILAASNIAWAGTSVVSGVARAIVFATAMHTEFGKIAHVTQSATEGDSPLRRDIQRLSKVISVFSLLLGGLFFFIGLWLRVPFWESFLFAIGIIVANVPEGLLPTLTLSLAMAAQRMAKRNALVRHLPKIEVLGSTTVICTDKTGTLTLNRMKVIQLYFAEGLCDPESPEPKFADSQAYRQAFEGALLCQDLDEIERNGARELAGDPMEVALVSMAKKQIVVEGRKVSEIPFDTARKRFSVAYAFSQGMKLYCKGAPESVLPLCTHAFVGSSLRELDQRLREAFQQAQDDMADRGLRVIALAHREWTDPQRFALTESELILDALAGIEDPPRPEVTTAIAKCRNAGIRVFMVTGDHAHTALAIARQIGLSESLDVSGAVLTGEQLNHMSDSQLQLALGNSSSIFARTAPEQKMRIVNLLKRRGEIVAVTGDGVNDAPALRSAHVGIAMGVAGTDVAKEAADLVLLDDNFATIVSAVEEGRGVFDNIRKFLTYILTSNVPELIPYLAFFIFKVPLALTVLQILMVDLGTDMVPALALGAESPDSDVMNRPPRSRSEPIVTAGVLARAYLFLGLLEAAISMGAFFFVLRSAGWTWNTPLPSDAPLYRIATTACLSAIIFSQVANVFLCRNSTKSTFTFRILSNRLILLGIIVELLVIFWINSSEAAHRVLGTAPVSSEVLLLIIPSVLVMVLLEEGRKAIVRSTAVLQAPRHGPSSPGLRRETGRDQKVSSRRSAR